MSGMEGDKKEEKRRGRRGEGKRREGRGGEENNKIKFLHVSS